eukprot:Polyplicarium_translucidae@DN2119_c0_g1_i2.p4
MQFDFSCGDLQALRNAAGVPPLCESPHISSDRSRNTDTFPVFSSGSVGVGQPHISSDQSRNEDGFSPLFSPRYTDLGAPHISSDRSRNEDAFCVSAGGWMPPSSDRSRGAFSPPISPMGVVSVDEGSSDGEFEGSQRVRLTPLPRGQKWRRVDANCAGDRKPPVAVFSPDVAPSFWCESRPGTQSCWHPER